MKKNKRNLISGIMVFGGLIILGAGVVINSLPNKEEGSSVSHEPPKVDKCKSISYDQKQELLMYRYLSEGEEKVLEYQLIKTNEEFNELLLEYEYDSEELNLDFSTYDYLIYFVYDNNCNNSKYLTDYKLEGNTLSIELTNSEFNKEQCSSKKVYGYVIKIEKDKFISGTSKVEITNKEDPFKDCYK